MNINDKVEIPNKKSVGLSINKCGAIKRAIKNNQSYLYIIKVFNNKNTLVLNDVPENTGGVKGGLFLITEVDKWKER